MSILETLMQQMLNSGEVKQMSQSVGADEAKTKSAIEAALPTLLGALSRNSTSADGAASLHRALEKDHDGGILNNLGGLLGGQLGGSRSADGAGILKHMLGGRQQRVEQGLSQTTGLDQGSTNKLMEMLAPAVMGAVGKEQRSKKLDAGALASMLSGEQRTIETKAPAGSNMISQLLDTDGDGDLDLSDMLKHGSKLFGR